MRGRVSFLCCVPALCCACLGTGAGQRESAIPPPCPEVTSDARPPEPVRATLVDCETVQPMVFEQVQPSGRAVASVNLDPEPARVRLYIRLDNLAGQDLLVGTCNDGLFVIDAGGPRPPCWPLEVTWALLPVGHSLLVSRMVPHPQSPSAVVSHSLVPNFGDAPERSWRTYVPDAVSFEVTPEGCRPLSAEEAIALRDSRT